MNTTCQECMMPNAPDYHPYLHCVIWKALHQDPAEVLAQYGYERVKESESAA